MEMWTFDRRVRAVPPGAVLRVEAGAPFRLRWTDGDWAAGRDTASTPTVVGVEFVDIPVSPEQSAPLRFTFFWPGANRWEGRDFLVDVAGSA